MTLEQGKKLVEVLKKQEYSDEEIAIVLHEQFRMGELNIEELNEIVGLVGYELSSEFYEMSEEEKKEPLYDVLENGDEEDNYDGFQSSKYPNEPKIQVEDEIFSDKRISELLGSFVEIIHTK